MDSVPQQFDWVWQAVIEQLVAAGDDPSQPDLTLRTSDRSLLGSVRPVGQIDGYVLLSTTSTQAKKLIEGQLSNHIAAALFQVTGKSLKVVLTVSEAAPENDNRYTNPGPGQPYTMRFDGVDEQSNPQHGSGSPLAAQGNTNLPQGTRDHQGNPRPQDYGRQGHADQTRQDNRQYGEQRPPAPADQDRRHHTDGGFDTGSDRGRSYGYGEGQANEYGTPNSAPSRHADHGSPGQPSTIGMNPAPTRPKVPHQMSDPVEEPTLNRKYTFETFVQGPQNKIAAASAVAVAESPGRSYNPLYIAGPSGLGKTHLLHAIGHYALNLHPQLKLKYVSSEEFTNDFITSLREDAQESFKRRYRNLDLLLVDDIQFLAGKEGTQEEFFHTFNALYQTNRQIVLSSDRPPSQLVTLEDRLRTRFEQGLFADLSLPDLETRIAILQKKVKQIESMSIPEDVLVFIAENNNTSIRALEGDLLQISAQASLLKRTPTVELAREVLGTQAEPVEITADLIIATTAEYFGLSVKDLQSPSRSRPVSHARQISMHLIRRMTNLSLVSIGAALGGRDHATVLHGDNKVEKEQEQKETTRREVNELTARIQEQARL